MKDRPGKVQWFVLRITEARNLFDQDFIKPHAYLFNAVVQIPLEIEQFPTRVEIQTDPVGRVSFFQFPHHA